MNKLLLAMLICGQTGIAVADTVTITAGKKTYIVNEKDTEAVKKYTRIAEIENRGYELWKKREQLKDELGLGELERMAVSTSTPRYEQIKLYRGADTNQLFSLLENEHFAGYWLVIARTIGMVADEAAAKKLADFATTAFPQDSAIRQRHVSAREGAMSGLTFATRGQPMPWVREFLIAHADADQWIEDFGEKPLDRKVADDLATNTLRAISRLGNAESLAMLREINARRTAELPLQPFGEGVEAQEPDKELEHLEMFITQTQQIAEVRARAEKAK